MRCLCLGLLILAGCASPQEIDKMEERWHEDRKVDARLFHKAETVPLLEANHREALEAVAVLGVTIDSRIEASETTTEGLLDTAFHHARDERLKNRAESAAARVTLVALVLKGQVESKAEDEAQRDLIARLRGRLEEKADANHATLAGLVSNMVDYAAVAKATAGILVDLERDLKAEGDARLSVALSLAGVVKDQDARFKVIDDGLGERFVETVEDREGAIWKMILTILGALGLLAAGIAGGIKVIKGIKA